MNAQISVVCRTSRFRHHLRGDETGIGSYCGVNENMQYDGKPPAIYGHVPDTPRV
jgi:hypothetical protein